MTVRHRVVRLRPVGIDRLAVGSVAVVAVAQFAAIGTKSLWADEAFSWSTSNRSWSSLLKLSFTRETNGLLYAVLLKVWMLGGQSEAWLRSFSAIATIATAVVVFRLGVVLANRRCAVAAVLLFGLNGSVISYGQNVRFYALVSFVTSLSMLAFAREVIEPSAKSLRRWVACCIILPWVHLLAIPIIAAEVISLGLLAPSARQLRRRITALAFAVPSIAVVALLVSRHDEGQNLLVFAPGDVLKVISGRAGVVGYGATALLVAAAIGASIDEVGYGPSLRKWSLGLCLCWVWVPIGALFVPSLVQPVFVGRYLLFVVPGIVLGAAIALEPLVWPSGRHRGERRRRSSFLLGFAVAFIVVGTLAGSRYWYRGDAGHDWRAASTVLLREARPSDGVLFANDSVRLFHEYYRTRQTRSTEPVPVYPSQPWGRYGTGDQRYLPFTTADLLRARKRYPRVWLVIETPLLWGANPPVWAAALPSDPGLLARYSANGVEVYLLEGVT